MIARKRPIKVKKPRNKPILPMLSTNPEFRVHYVDLEEFVKKCYGSELDFFKAAGMSHGMLPEYRVSGEIAATSQRSVQHIRTREKKINKNFALLLNVLAHDEFIPKGDYVIDTRKLRAPTDIYRDLLEEHRDPQHSECLEYRKKHQKDKAFKIVANQLDQACREVYL